VAYAAKPVSDDALAGLYPTIAEGEANARLIAAAPDLLATLKRAAAFIPLTDLGRIAGEGGDAILRDCLAVIAKAEGAQ
jgi:hypothetical protein